MTKEWTFRALMLTGLLGGCGGGSSGGGGAPAPIPPTLGGLDSRPQNLTCVAPAAVAGGAAEIALEPLFSALSFAQPLGMSQAPGDDARWFVLEKSGRIRAFENVSDVASFDADFINLGASFMVNTASEGGLLGLAFAGDFAAGGPAYVSWTEGSSPMVSVVSRFTSADGGATLDPGSRADVIRVNQDFGNHNGGHIAFGPDGYLYLGLGDGGSAGDPNSRAQDTRNLLGAMLRLDVSGTPGYAIPPTNPFAGNSQCPADHTSATDCPEIYAWGLRNPWRWSFDRATGALWAGDVGQGSFEEVDRIELGRNYGWDCREAFAAFASPAASCAIASNLVDPVDAYGRSDGISVTGGYVYRGAAIPSLAGNYVFGDFGSGRIWRLAPDGSGGYTREELLDTTLAISSFAEDQDGELYVVDYNGGIYAIVGAAGSGGGVSPVPELLSATGCFDPNDPAAPAGGLIPYSVAAPQWSDGAEAERWLAVPDGSAIGVSAEGDFALPAGTVLSEHLRMSGRLVETRLLMRHLDGVWAGYSYEWNEAETDATLVIGGKSAAIDGQTWLFPESDQCLRCHTAAAGFALGLDVAQLNHSMRYAPTGRTANQLATLDAIALFNSPLGDPMSLPSLSEPSGAGAVGERARAYLQANCSGCHRPGGPTPSTMDLRASVSLGQMQVCDTFPMGVYTEIPDVRIVAPGDPDRSVLLDRISRRGEAGQMPPLATSIVDAEGIALIRSWIAGLTGC